MTQPKHPAPWKWIDKSIPGDALAADLLPELVDANGDRVCWFGDGKQYYATEGEALEGAAKELIRAAPEMAALLDEAADYEVRGFRDYDWQPEWFAKVAALLARIDAAKDQP